MLQSVLSRSQSGLDLGLLGLAQLRKFFLCGVVRSSNLVERVVGVLLEFFPDLVDLLVSPQALLVLHLVESSLLIDSVGSLETSLWMSIDLVGAVGIERKSIQSVVDTGSVEGGSGRWCVESGKVESARLLDCGLCVTRLLRGQCSVFFGK